MVSSMIKILRAHVEKQKSGVHTMTPQFSTILRRQSFSFAMVVALSSLAGACSTADRVVTGNPYPDNYKERHPIVLTDSTRTLDVFTGRGKDGLDARQEEDVRSFVGEYLGSGKGGIRAIMPVGTGQEAYAQRTLSAIRQAISKAGGQGPVSIASYHPHDPTVVAPIRLVYQTMRAKVGSTCGQWPQDLGSGPSIDGWRNNPHWNLGCSIQSNMAQQAADPLDLVRGRAEGRIDTIKRAGGMDRLRQGKDPSTKYESAPTQINQSVGTN
jgi:pilus assembly protein CpaD